ncbi:50S ribosomal protein L35ae [Candidatus Woesearchaeota archaeon]|nr:50S ribosomal protein L35ae [Candidatus Woesearchaeota archaeon]
MEGILANFRRGRHTLRNKQMIVHLDSLKNKEEARKLIGKSITWKSEKGKEITGKVINFHGNKGALRVAFEIGLPGQSLGTKVKVI